MDRLKRAVEAGIISEHQRKAIQALAPETNEFQFSLVHVLWFCGAGLIGFALFLLAIEISDNSVERFAWVCLVYTGALAVLDYVIKGRKALRLLSSLVLLTMGFTAACAVAAFLDAQFQLRDVGQSWKQLDHWSEFIVRGPYLYSSVLIGVSAILIKYRGFLPAWIALLGALTVLVCDVFYGLRLEKVLAVYSPWLGLSVVFLGWGWWLDLRTRANHGFWLNKVALILFTVFVFIALFETSWRAGDYWILLPAALILVLYSVYIRRPTGVSAGAFALASYLGQWFQAWDNLYVASALISVFGLGAIFAGVRAHLVEDQLDKLLPQKLKDLRPEARSDPVTFGF